MAQEWVTDHAGMRAMLKSAAIEAVLSRAANNIAGFARSIAPVGSPPDDEHPGLYRDSFSVEPHSRPDRAEVDVINSAPYAAFIEFGTSTLEARHILMRAASEGHGI
jgi:hypothetical protein